MNREYTVIWAAKIIADSQQDGAIAARRTIANAPYSYFDVYTPHSDQPYSVEVPNDGHYLDTDTALVYHSTTRDN